MTGGYATTRLSESSLEATATHLRYVRFFDDFPVYPLNNIWDDTDRGDASEKVTSSRPTPGRRAMPTHDHRPRRLGARPDVRIGTTAYVAEQWGRRWITCDTSRVAITLAKQRLMTASLTTTSLAHPDEGVGSGFRYKTVPHVTSAKSESRNRSSRDREVRRQETLYDQPFDRKSRGARHRSIHRRSCARPG